MSIRPIVAAIGMFSLLTGCNHISSLADHSPVKTLGASPMLTILTSADAETQLMALVLTKAAFDKGQNPRILLCSSAGDLALKDAPASATAPLAPKRMSPQALLQVLIGAEVQVDVCAIYLPNRPFGQEALLDGIGIAAPADIAKAFGAGDTTVLSF